MFNRETCKVCGTCLAKCPFIEISRKEAQKEMALLIEGNGSKEILNNCLLCGFCDIICPTQSNPSHLRKEIRTGKRSGRGTVCLSVFTDDVPFNMMSIGLEYEPEKQKKDYQAFHDPCSWRMLSPEIRENARKLLQVMGAEVVEMEHNREKTLCCGTPLAISGRNPQLASEVAAKRVGEAEDTGAEAIVVSCTGCFGALVEKAEEHNMDVYYITELAQMAIGEKPLHRLQDMKNQLAKNIMNKINENPGVLKQKYVIKNREVVAL